MARARRDGLWSPAAGPQRPLVLLYHKSLYEFSWQQDSPSSASRLPGPQSRLRNDGGLAAETPPSSRENSWKPIFPGSKAISVTIFYFFPVEMPCQFVSGQYIEAGMSVIQS